MWCPSRDAWQDRRKLDAFDEGGHSGSGEWQRSASNRSSRTADGLQEAPEVEVAYPVVGELPWKRMPQASELPRPDLNASEHVGERLL